MANGQAWRLFCGGGRPEPGPTRRRPRRQQRIIKKKSILGKSRRRSVQDRAQTSAKPQPGMHAPILEPGPRSGKGFGGSGCWFLVVGFWLLAIGYWLLAC